MFSPASVPIVASGGSQPPDPAISQWGHDYSFDPGPPAPVSIAPTVAAPPSGVMKKRKVMRGNTAAAETQRSVSSMAPRRKSLGQKPRLLRKHKISGSLNMSFGSAVEVHPAQQPYTQYADQHISPAPQKRRRTSEDFLTFCRMVLEYERSLQVANEENRKRHSSSPLGSTGSSAGSWTSGSGSGAMGVPKDELSDEQVVPLTGRRQQVTTIKGDDGSVVTDGDGGDDGWNQITCFCNKPYAGLPMVECTSCFTWLHQKCARLKRNRKIPDDWRCYRCEAKTPKTESSPKSASSSPKITGSRKRKSSTSKRRQPESKSEEQRALFEDAVDQSGDHPEPDQ